jgi:hypothetical protein
MKYLFKSGTPTPRTKCIALFNTISYEGIIVVSNETLGFVPKNRKSALLKGIWKLKSLTVS